MDYSKLLGRIKEKGFTQASVARMIKVSPTTMNGKLNGHVEFSQSEIRNLCKVCVIPFRNLCKVLHIQDSDIPAFFFTEKLEKSQEFITERTDQNE